MARRAQAGQPFEPPRAADHNALLNLLDQSRARGPRGQGPHTMRDRNAGIVRVKNTSSGTNWERGEAVRVYQPIITPAANESYWQQVPQLAARDPAGQDDLGRLAILLESIPYAPDKNIGLAVIDGVVQTVVNVIEEWHEYADCDPISGGRTLVSNPDGSSTCHILWKESGTGAKKATVRIGNPPQVHLIGQPVGYGISARVGNLPGTGTIQVYRLDESTGEIEPLLYDGQPCYLDVYTLSDSAIPEGEWVLAHCDRWGVWWI